jgi:YD repeat-containing protein
VPYDGLELTNNATNWTLTDKSRGTAEKFDLGGRLISYAEKSGRVFALNYSNSSTSALIAPLPNLLIEIDSGTNRTVSFSYMPTGRLKDVSLNGTVLQSFTYDLVRDELLGSIRYLDGTSKTYLYEPGLNPGLSAPSEQALFGALTSPGSYVPQSEYTGPTPIGVMAQSINGRMNRSSFTGVVDESNQRFATYIYDDFGRVTREFHGNSVEPYDFSYVTSMVETRLTDSLGSVATQYFGAANGKLVLLSQTQPAGSGCAASVSSQTFDSNTNIASRDDFNGNRVCFFNDLGRNTETARIEGLGSTSSCSALSSTTSALPAGSRRITSLWHPDWNIRAKLAEPGRIVTSVYNGQPDPFAANAPAACAPANALLPNGKPIAVLCKQVEQATTDADGSVGFSAPLQGGVPARVQSWTYNQFGQVLTARGARTDVNDTTTYAYYADTSYAGIDPNAFGHSIGDPFTTTNALGQTTTYTKYNRHGQLLEMVDANSVVTSNTFDLRQRLTSTGVGGQVTTYGYWPTGLLKRVTQPDGSFVSYEYDTAHRQTAVQDNLGNRIVYTLDNAGNRTGEETKDPTGALRRALTRSIDALGRVQQVTGRE